MAGGFQAPVAPFVYSGNVAVVVTAGFSSLLGLGLGSGAFPSAPVISLIGVVPVRYIIGVIPNVVPVETVLVGGIGVVSVREFVGPANVVPVRETLETPRVKVIKV